jgi:predicted nuclease of predicted toxin-antitoxin system
VKLLLDENISPRAVAALQELYPKTVHVRDVDLASAADQAVWSFAAELRPRIRPSGRSPQSFGF